jgi:AraC family transcriptional regulator
MFRSLKTGAATPGPRKQVRAGGFSVELQGPGWTELVLPRRLWHVLSVVLESDVSIERADSARSGRGSFREGDVGLYPSGPGERIRWRGTARLVHIHVHPRLLAERAGDMVLPRRFRFRDSRCVRLARELAAMPGNPGSSLVDEMKNAVLDRLIDLGGTGRPSSTVELPSRSAAVLDQVTDYVSDHQGDTIRISQLAGLARMSEAHFSRCFRAAVGMSPHEYIIRARLERARYLLGRGERPSTVAFLCGFADQSHLTRTCQSAWGTTPGELRTQT